VLMSERETVERIVDSIRRRDAHAYGEFFTEEGLLGHPLSTEPIKGKAAIVESEQAIFDAFSDIDVEIRSIIGDHRRAAAEVVLRATNTGPINLGNENRVEPTGRRIEIEAVWIFDFAANGLVNAERDYLDTAGLMSQLGLEE
jgi:predicted ester cyclase